MVKRWIVTLLIVALSLAACMPVQPPGQISATAVPAEEETAEPAGEATEEATEEPTVELVMEPEEVVDIAAVVSQALADQLQIDPADIEVVTVEDVEWPDACLGVQSPDIMCAQVITPGFRLVLEANGEQYEYHTNLDGSSIVLFEEPKANLEDVLVTWHREGGFAGFCDDLIAYVSGELTATSCKVQPTETVARRPMTPEEQAQLQGWIDQYAPFEYNHSDGAVADSMTVALVFSGAGSTPADEAAQQEILRFVENIYAEMAM